MCDEEEARSFSSSPLASELDCFREQLTFGEALEEFAFDFVRVSPVNEPN
jgi:hypothetical protein